MTMEIIAHRRHAFCYGHRVVGHEGRCKQLHGHEGVVTFHCEPVADYGEGTEENPWKPETYLYALDKVGRVVDFAVIKEVCCEWLEENWDHRMLLWDKDPLLEELKKLDEKVVTLPFNPTAENLAGYLLDKLNDNLREYCTTKGIPLVRLTQIDFMETSKCGCTVTRPRVGGPPATKRTSECEQMQPPVEDMSGSEIEETLIKELAPLDYSFDADPPQRNKLMSFAIDILTQAKLHIASGRKAISLKPIMHTLTKYVDYLERKGVSPTNGGAFRHKDSYRAALDRILGIIKTPAHLKEIEGALITVLSEVDSSFDKDNPNLGKVLSFAKTCIKRGIKSQLEDTPNSIETKAWFATNIKAIKAYGKHLLSIGVKPVPFSDTRGLTDAAKSVFGRGLTKAEEAAVAELAESIKDAEDEKFLEEALKLVQEEGGRQYIGIDDSSLLDCHVYTLKLTGKQMRRLLNSIIGTK